MDADFGVRRGRARPVPAGSVPSDRTDPHDQEAYSAVRAVQEQETFFSVVIAVYSIRRLSEPLKVL